jgi:hypothetical protein
MYRLDKAARLAAEADEPESRNFVRKHTRVCAAELGISFAADNWSVRMTILKNIRLGLLHVAVAINSRIRRWRRVPTA